MEKAKIRPLATPKPLNRFSPKLAGVITSWTAPGVQNFVAIGSGVSVSVILPCFCGDLVFCSFSGSSIMLQPIHPWTDIYAKYVKRRRSG